MEQNRNRRNDPMAELFAIAPHDDLSVEESVEKVVQRARRQVGAHDVLSLMLVNLWQVLTQMLVPLFLINKHHKNKGDDHGKS